MIEALEYQWLIGLLAPSLMTHDRQKSEFWFPSTTSESGALALSLVLFLHHPDKLTPAIVSHQNFITCNKNRSGLCEFLTRLGIASGCSY